VRSQAGSFTTKLKRIHEGDIIRLDARFDNSVSFVRTISMSSDPAARLAAL
jgi:hypothetical protein